MNYPNRIIRINEPNSAIVTAIQQRLNDKGCGPIDIDGQYGQDTFGAVELFQVRFVDQNKNPLTVDGEVGPLTWEALFGEDTVPSSGETESPLLTKVLGIAASQVGVREEPLGSNSGPEVDVYLASVGLGAGDPWCAAFVYWCFKKASAELDVQNELIRTGSVLAHWNEATCSKITSKVAFENPAIVKPGDIFIIAHSSSTGHTGLVEKVKGGFITTIEGNTNDGGSREGIGVFRRTRKIKDINRGFLEY